MNKILPRGYRAWFVAALFTGLLFAATPYAMRAQTVTGVANYGGNGFALTIPQNWVKSEREFSAKGVTGKRLTIYQTNDATSRTTKYFSMVSGAPEAVFGLRKKVVDRVTREQLVDLLIDQEANANIDYIVTKTSVKGAGETRIYVIEANHSVPGYRMNTVTNVSFRKGVAYVWTYGYLNTFSFVEPTLRGISDSVVFN